MLGLKYATLTMWYQLKNLFLILFGQVQLSACLFLLPIFPEDLETVEKERGKEEKRDD